MIDLISDAVLPIAWILALGFGLKRYTGIDDAVWRGLEKISYWVLDAESLGCGNNQSTCD